MKYFLTVLFSIIFYFFSQSQPSSFSPKGIGGGGALFFPKINPVDDNNFYISCDMSQMFRSNDFGNSFTQIHFTQLQSLNVSTYEFTNDPNIAYCNFNDGNDGYPVKTTNAGNTWVQLPGFNAANGGVYRMFANFNNPQQLVMNYYGQIVISNDGGNTFSLVKQCANMGVGIIVAGVFYDGNNIYIASNEGIFHSSNAGVTFSPMTTTGIAANQVIWHFSGAKSGATTRFVCITANSSDIYNGIMPYDYYQLAKGVYTMDNTNGTWVSKSVGINFSNDFVMYTGMAYNNVNTIYLAGSDNALNAPLIYKSTDAGTTWNKVFQTTNNQNINTGWSGFQGDKQWSWGETAFGIAVAPNNADKIVFGDYGFIHVSSNGGSTWKQAYVSNTDQHSAGAATPTKKYYHSIGLENTTAWQVFWKDANNMYGCFSDIGCIRSKDAGDSWSYDYNGFSVNSLYRMLSTPNGNIYGACSNIHDMYQSTRLADAPLDNNDNNGKIVFSTDGGNTFSNLHVFNHPVFWLAQHTGNPNTLYASVIHYGNGNGQGGIWVTKDLQQGAASQWTKLPKPPRTEGHPANIIVLNDGKVLCTFSGRRNAAGAFTASSGVFLYDTLSNTWSDVSDAGMYYWTKDIIVAPDDITQSTWYVCVFSGWGGPPNGLGGLYKTTNRGASWTKLTGTQFDRVTSLAFNPQNTSQAYLTTETQGLWISNNMSSPTPTWNLVQSYPFRQPERVYFNPFNTNELWVTSFGNGMKVGLINGANSTTSFFDPPEKMDVYPNPSTSIVYIKNKKGKQKEIYNARGIKILTTIEDKVNVSNLAKGIYYIVCDNSIKKIIIE